MLDLFEMKSHNVLISCGPNVPYLGRAGAMSIGDFNVGWLSGIARAKMLPVRNTGKKERTYYVASEVEVAKKQGLALGDIHVLITHDWRSGIRDGMGTQLICSITESLQLQLHICGHRYSFHQAIIGKTSVHAVNAVPSAVMGDDLFGCGGSMKW